MNKLTSKIFIKELSKNKVYIIFYTLVVSLLLAAFVSLVCCMNYMPNNFWVYYTEGIDNIDAIIKGDTANISGVLDSNTAVYYDGEGITYNVNVSSKNNSIHLPDYMSGKCFDFKDGANFFVDKSKLNGNLWAENDKNGIWLMDMLATYLGVGINDKVKISNKEYIVKGIYTEGFVKFKASFIMGKNDLDVTNCTSHLLIKADKNTPFLYSKISKLGIEIQDDYHYIELYSNLLTIMIVIGICTSIIGISIIVIFVNLISYFQLKRQKLIYMLVSLGATKTNIDTIVVLVAAFISLVAMLVGGLLGYGLTEYFSYLINSIVGINEKVTYLWYLPMVMFVVLVVLALITTKTFWHKKSTREGLSEVENEN